MLITHNTHYGLLLLIILMFSGTVGCTQMNYSIPASQISAGPPFIPEIDEQTRKGSWCDVVLLTHNSFSYSGFLVPTTDGFVTFDEVLSQGIYYRDMIDRAEIIQILGANTRFITPARWGGDDMGMAYFEDGFVKRKGQPDSISNCEISHEERQFRKSLIHFKGLRLYKVNCQEPGQSAGFIIPEFNDPRSPYESIGISYYVRNWQEIRDFIACHPDGVSGIFIAQYTESLWIDQESDFLISYSPSEVPVDLRR